MCYFILYRLIFCVLNYMMRYNLNYYVIREYMIVYNQLLGNLKIYDSIYQIQYLVTNISIK